MPFCHRWLSFILRLCVVPVSLLRSHLGILVCCFVVCPTVDMPSLEILQVATHLTIDDTTPEVTLLMALGCVTMNNVCLLGRRAEPDQEWSKR